MKKVDKIRFWLSLLFRILLVVAGVIAVFTTNWINLALAVFTMFLTFLPSIVERRYKLDLPSEIEILVLLFVYGSLYLGELYAFYEKFWWWDLFLHAYSGIMIGIAGFALVYVLNKEKKLTFNLSPLFIAMFSFSFSVALGVMWEIFEFVMDSVFDFNMLKSGLVDTMWDLIVDTSGALLVALIGYFYVKKDPQIWEKLVRKMK